MPKKKKKRKKGPSYTPASGGAEAGSPEQGASRQNGTSSRVQEELAGYQKFLFELEQAQGIRGQLLFKLGLLWPLALGALAGSQGFELNLSGFYCLFFSFLAALILSALVLTGRAKGLLPVFLYASILFLLIFNYQTPLFLALQVLALLLLGYAESREISDGRTLFLSLGSYLGLFLILPILSLYLESERYFPSVAILGLIPGLMFMATIWAEKAGVLDWPRTRTTKKAQERPGADAQVFGLLAMIGPTLGAVLGVIGYLPPGFALTGVLFFWVPAVCDAYWKEQHPQQWFPGRVLRLAGVLTGLVTIGVLMGA